MIYYAAIYVSTISLTVYNVLVASNLIIFKIRVYVCVCVCVCVYTIKDHRNK